MPDQYTEVTTTGYGARIIKSIKGVVFGVVLFVTSFGVLWWNEGRVDLSKIAKTATEISCTGINTDSLLNGKLVSTTGILSSDEEIGDNLFLKPGKYIVVKGVVEMYSWLEEARSQSETKVGGSKTTRTAYTYKKEWREYPSQSSSFKYPEGHENPQKTIESSTNKVTEARIGVYSLDISSVDLSGFLKLQLSEQNVTLGQGAILANNDYVYIGRSSYALPEIGDLRISYSVLTSSIKATVLGKLDGSFISPYFDQNNNRLYCLFPGTKDEAIATLYSEYTRTVWIFRLVGFLMMWMGLAALFGPITVLLDIVPIFGSLSRAVISTTTFLVTLVLTVVTIIVAMIAHSIIALIILVGIATSVIIAGFMLKKKKATAEPVTTLPQNSSQPPYASPAPPQTPYSSSSTPSLPSQPPFQ